MSWSAPRTWVAGEVVTAALLNAHLRDNLLEIGDPNFGTWAPVVTQNASTPTKTTDNASYSGNAVSDQISGYFHITFTGAASGVGGVTMTAPVTPAYAGSSYILACGTGLFYDASATQYINVTLGLLGGVFVMVANNVAGATFGAINGPAIVIASGDQMSGQFFYEA